MKQQETITQFQARHGRAGDGPSSIHLYRLEDHSASSGSPYSRRDFYKIMLFKKADGILCYGDKRIPVKDCCLVFTNAQIPYSWEGSREELEGYLCLFAEGFLGRGFKTGLSRAAIFTVGRGATISPVFPLNKKSFAEMAQLFDQMIGHMTSPYPNRNELLRNYIQIFIHCSLEMRPAEKDEGKGSSFARISQKFLTLLDQQFPIWSPDQVLALKNANEFAVRLGVHTNHLNKALREYTGKTTSGHITEYIVREARALLQHSDWRISDIAHCLGFGHASNFDIFFKKHTGQTPRAFRMQPASIS